MLYKSLRLLPELKDPLKALSRLCHTPFNHVEGVHYITEDHKINPHSDLRQVVGINKDSQSDTSVIASLCYGGTTEFKLCERKSGELKKHAEKLKVLHQ